MKTAELVLPFSQGPAAEECEAPFIHMVKNAFLPPQSPALSSLFQDTPIQHSDKNLNANFTPTEEKGA